MQKIRHIYVPVLILASAMTLCAIFFSCNSMQKTQPVISVTIQPQKYLLEKIVGDKYLVVCMLAQGSNPEAYEPNLNQLMNLEKSDAYFCVGNLGFELAILNRVHSNVPDLKIYNISKGIAKMKGTHEATVVKKGANEIDPHVWTSVKNAKVISRNMYEAMLQIDPKHKKNYTDNYKKLIVELDTLDAQITRQLLPLKGSAFAVWHPSLSYFARDYGLRQIAIESEGKEMTPEVLKKGIDLAKAQKVKVLFSQKEFDGRQVQAVNQQLGAKLVEINPMNYDWEAEMKQIAHALAAK